MSLTLVVVNVVCQHRLETSSVTTSCAVTGSVSGSAGAWRLAPLAVACTFALPATPAFSMSFTTPSGSPTPFRYEKLDDVARQHGLVPHVPPGGTSASSSGCAFPDASYRHTRYVTDDDCTGSPKSASAVPPRFHFQTS